MEIYDLDNEIPESDKVSLSINNVKYTIPLVVSYGLGCFMLNHKEELAQIFDASGRPTLSKKTLDFAYSVAVELIKEQDPLLITDTYIKKYLSVPKLIILILRIANPFLQHMNKYGSVLIGSPSTDGKETKKKVQ